MKLLPSTVVTVQRRRHRRREQTQQRSRSMRQTVVLVLVVLIGTGLIFSVGSVGLAVGVYYSYARTLPKPGDIAKIHEQFETTRIYDRTGQTVLYQVVDPSGDRQSVPLSEIPKNLVNSTLAIEDKTFYTNPGFDISSMIRALRNSLDFNTVQGGSTITQQLVKNTLIPVNERTAVTRERKIKEVILAAEISRLYSKDQILEWYLNTNFYGNLAYGVDAAAKVYFGKHVQDLNLGEASLLAAIPQNPQENPIDDPIAARRRQAIVLDSMVTLGYITRDEATEAASQTIIIQPITERYDIVAPHFSIYARRQAEQLLNAQGLDGSRLVLGGGLRIYTTLDLDLQAQVECAARSYVRRLGSGSPALTLSTAAGQPCTAAQYLLAPPNFNLATPHNVTNSAVVVVRPNTGEILSMIGSVDYFDAAIQGNYNAALGLRQPGSAFKPFVYVTAFASNQNRYTPATMLLDVPTKFNNGTYVPKNEDDKFHGPVTIREALANSYNIPAVSVINDISVGQVIRTARQLGIMSLKARLEQYGIALALGSSEVSLVDLTYSYSVFANLGTMVGTPISNPLPGYRNFDPVLILRIEDKDGNVLWRYDENQSTFGKQNVLRDALAYLINNILSDNDARLPAFGKGNALELSRPAAAKTGTTNDNRDAWTVGYTPQLVTGVWVGNNNNDSMGDDITGATAAAPIWHAIMEYYHKRDNLPVQDWPRPSTIKEQRVCQKSGLLPTPDCSDVTVKELFLVDDTTNTIPTQRDIYWKLYQINSRNGLRATSSTPPELLARKLYFDYPLEAVEWAKSMKLPFPPTQYDSAGAAETLAIGSITTPKSLDRVHGIVEVKGKLAMPTNTNTDIASYNLEYGAGMIPNQWVSIGGGDPKGRGTDVLLGRWDTTDLEGLYTLRLGIVLKDGSFQPYTLQVTVDNQPPTIEVLSPQPQTIISANDSLTLQVKTTDNLEVAAIEFYHNGTLLKKVTKAPYTLDWKPDKPGLHSFYMIAYDSAGNSTQSQSVQVTVKP